ncbi:MAG: hypothetical protein UX17_C0007G0018 [Parcubacteria group bacterium GW2011_GWC2_45_7]|nr:MAG: hypothetical protein UX17_C0007G0018 [Parcubacteria group bacterium GW2011_GWC2_45_7]KKU73836.1 MAG: hypothetical protein UX98_C0004G0035 [Parcubacteria group bacterium GW2011_GWA2_47_26]
MPDFEILPHTADLRIKVYGNSRAELFQNALRGMFESIAPTWKAGAGVQHEIAVVSTDQNALLIDFLSEALSLSDINDEAYTDIEITEFTNTELRGTLIGKSITRFAIEIKAVTHHGIDIKKIGERWETEIVFDV